MYKNLNEWKKFIESGIEINLSTWNLIKLLNTLISNFTISKKKKLICKQT